MNRLIIKSDHERKRANDWRALLSEQIQPREKKQPVEVGCRGTAIYLEGSKCHFRMDALLIKAMNMDVWTRSG